MDDQMQSMEGKNCVVTGATSGIGRAAALRLGELGANVVAIGRNESRGAKLIHRLCSSQHRGKHLFLKCDLSHQIQVRKLAAEIAERVSFLDLLINNAGANFDSFQLSNDGIEMTFATNHLSHFLLTSLLLPLLLKGDGQSRVINVSGQSHTGADADFAECLKMETFDRKKARRRSKLANLLFTYDLSERLKTTKVTVNAVHPGGVATRIGMNNGIYSWIRHVAAHSLKRNLITPQKGSDTIVYLAASSEIAGVTGKYFFKRKVLLSSPVSYDKKSMRGLWNLSLKMTGISGNNCIVWKYYKPS